MQTQSCVRPSWCYDNMMTWWYYSDIDYPKWSNWFCLNYICPQSSDRSSSSDDVLLILLALTGALICDVVLLFIQATFSDFHSVNWCHWCYKSHSKSLKTVSMQLMSQDANWCLLNVKCSNVPMFQTLQYSNVPIF